MTNGDIVVDHLRRAGLAADALAWADVLHEGPVPAGLDDAGLRRVRAEFLAAADGLDAGAVRRRFEERDRALSVNHAGDYLLWFEADLYDQLQLAQILAALGDLGVAPDRVELVCIGEYPGIAHFGGLGELEPGSSPACWRPPPADRRGPRPGRRRLGGAAGGRPRRAGRGRGQPLAPAALPRRGLRPARPRVPSTRDGLSLTERRLLAATQQGGEPSAGAVFARLGERARPFLADLFCFRILARLAGAGCRWSSWTRPPGR